jgi:hypothetical protein
MQSSIPISLVFALMFVLSGCIAPTNMSEEEKEPTESAPIYVSFSANSLDRLEDKGEYYDLRSNFDGPILLLWIAAGCQGCHDWTDMIRESRDNGNISNETNIVSIHRYPSFESTDEVASWPVLVPSENTRAINFLTGEMTDLDIYTAFDNPVTPTLQVLNEDGKIIWTSKTYWAEQSVLDEALSIM